MRRCSSTLTLLLAVACEPWPPADPRGDGGGPGPTDPPQVFLRDAGLTPDRLGIVVNTDDPLSAEVAAAYVAAHGVPEANVVSLSLGVGAELSAEAFAAAEAATNAALPEEVEALLLAFYAPYRVSCMGAAAAFGLGFDPAFCGQVAPCGPTRASPLYGVASARPWSDLGVRPTMMLSGATLADAQAVIDRGVASLGSAPPGEVVFVRTTDAARSVRSADQQATTARFDPEDGLLTTYLDASADPSGELLVGRSGLLGYQTGLASVGGLDTLAFRPGALADHLTSYGGVLDGSAGQMSIVEWLNAGATASYGTAIEPCNYQEKFPRASVLWPAYFQGATAVEAYWRSVAWPGEGNFVGDPLARPFASTVTWEDGVLTIVTPRLDPNTSYAVEAADAEEGPWELVTDGLDGGPVHRWQTVVVSDAWRPFYRLVAAGR